MAIPPENQHQMEKSIKIHLACFKPKRTVLGKRFKGNALGSERLFFKRIPIASFNPYSSPPPFSD
jgi:hypothetical protein